MPLGLPAPGLQQHWFRRLASCVQRFHPSLYVALEKDGTVTVMSSGVIPEFRYNEQYDVETSLQTVHYGTYEKEDTTLTIQCSGDLYQRLVVRGKGKAAYIKEMVSHDESGRAYFEKGKLLSPGSLMGESVIIEIDTSEDAWKLVSEQWYYESGALSYLLERSDSGNFVGTKYYEDGKIQQLCEWGSDGIVTSFLGYHENGNVSFQTEYYEDGTSKSYVEYYENGNICCEEECYPNGGVKKSVVYDVDGTELEYREYDQDGNIIVERP